MLKKILKTSWIIGHLVIALAIIGLSLACSFYLRETETKDDYLDALRDSSLKIDRDEILLNDLQSLLLKINSNNDGSVLYLEHEPIASELQVFVNNAYLSINERRLMIGFELQAIINQDR